RLPRVRIPSPAPLFLKNNFTVSRMEKENYTLNETQIQNQNFENGVNEVASFLKNLTPHTRIRLISHHDADGLTAAGIMARAFLRSNLRYHISIHKNLDEEAVTQLSTDKNWDVLLFTDLASSKVEQLGKIAQSRPVIILDHHQMDSPQAIPKGLILLNPHLYKGIDGSSDISGAGVAYFVCAALDSRNQEAAPYAIIGALGDRQDFGKQGSLVGLNKKIVETAKNLSLLSDDADLWIYGSQTRPLLRVLENLEFVKLENVIKLLDEIQIQAVDGNRPRTLADLSTDEKKTLATALITHYDLDADQIFKKVYILEKEPKNTFLRDAREFSAMLNALGRMGRADLAIGLILGDRRKSLSITQKVYEQYKARLSSALSFASVQLKDLGSFLYLDGRNKINETIIGTVCSILISKDLTKPLLGVASTEDNKKLKLSLRIPANIRPQINVAQVLRESLLLFAPQSEVGGHKGAAGAVISPEVLDQFLNRLKEQF
ncbi:MAG: DHHA1 domain-containing protein, partial [Promethearchaeota archaeon]